MAAAYAPPASGRREKIRFEYGQPQTLAFDGVDAAIDQVRHRFGKSALTRAVLVGHDPGPEMPHLPD